MQHLTYLAVMAACLIGTLPLEYAFNARVYRRFARAVRAIAPVAAVFLIWDYFAILAGWWWFDPEYITGIYVGALPIEEITFFVAIPICGILTLEAVRHLKPHWAEPWRRARTAPTPPDPEQQYGAESKGLDGP